MRDRTNTVTCGLLFENGLTTARTIEPWARVVRASIVIRPCRSGPAGATIVGGPNAASPPAPGQTTEDCGFDEGAEGVGEPDPPVHAATNMSAPSDMMTHADRTLTRRNMWSARLRRVGARRRQSHILTR